MPWVGPFGWVLAANDPLSTNITTEIKVFYFSTTCIDNSREKIVNKYQRIKAITTKEDKMIDNGNWTEWSAIWAEIISVISNLNERTARVRFEITSTISDQNCTTRGSITTLLHPFWNRPNTGLGQFKYLLLQYWASLELKSSIFWEEKIRVLETKVAKFATWYSMSFIFLQFDRLL